MSKKKTRERQLAKWQARRDAARRRRRRNRIIAGILALAVALGGTAFAAITFLGGEDPDPSASPSPTVTASPTATASPSPSPSPDPLPVACGGKIPEASGEEKRTFRKVPPLTLDLEATYVATLQTSCGAIEIELFPREAPYTVNSFVFLAEKGYFDGQTFFRVANSIDVIQAGDPTCLGPRIDDCARDADGGPGYTIPDETFNELPFEVGSLAMANAGPGTAGSQFFLITGDLGLQLPPNYTVFGKIVGGLDVAREIQSIPVGEEGATDAETPTEIAYIESVTITVRG